MSDAILRAFSISDPGIKCRILDHQAADAADFGGWIYLIDGTITIRPGELTRRE